MSLLGTQTYVNETQELWQPFDDSEPDMQVLSRGVTQDQVMTSGTPSYYQLHDEIFVRKKGTYKLSMTLNVIAPSVDSRVISLQVRDANGGPSYFLPYPAITVATKVQQQMSASWVFHVAASDPANPIHLQMYCGTSNITGGAPTANMSFVLEYYPDPN